MAIEQQCQAAELVKAKSAEHGNWSYQGEKPMSDDAPIPPTSL